MKISSIQVCLVGIPETQSLAKLPVTPVTREFVLVRVRTDDGLEGIGLTFHFYANPLSSALLAATRALADLTMGMDPLRPEQIAAYLNSRAGGGGPAGLFMLAAAAIDMALWDIRGKACGQPVWKLLGGYRDRLPAYASGAIRRELNDDEAIAQAAGLVEQGYCAIKMQLGLPGDNPSADLRRLHHVRQAIGSDVELMVDINQGWNPARAKSMMQRLDAETPLAWIEDPISSEDVDGIARLSSGTRTPLAAGEYLWGIKAFERMIRQRAVDILIIDLFRVGGVTPWMKVASMAEAAGLPVSGHIAPEILCHLVGSVPNGAIVECVPWTTPLFESTPRIIGGQIELPGSAGFGLAIDEDFLAAHVLANSSR